MNQTPEMSAARLTQRREHLMAHVSQSDHARAGVTGGWRQRRWGLATAAGAAFLALTGGAVATAGSSGIYRESNGDVTVDMSRLNVVHNGKIVNGDSKKFQYSAVNQELACQGIMLVFGTAKEADSYLSGFKARQEQRRAKRVGNQQSKNPCSEYADAPRLVNP